MYNMTNLTNANTMVEYFTGINQITEPSGLLTSILMLVMFIIILMVFSNYPKKVVLLADSFIMTIIGVFFFIMGFIKLNILIVPILVLLVSIFLYKFLPD